MILNVGSPLKRCYTYINHIEANFSHDFRFFCELDYRQKFLFAEFLLSIYNIILTSQRKKNHCDASVFINVILSISSPMQVLQSGLDQRMSTMISNNDKKTSNKTDRKRLSKKTVKKKVKNVNSRKMKLKAKNGNPSMEACHVQQGAVKF